MGNTAGKEKEGEWDSPILRDMKKKYGPDCTDCMTYWTEKYGFPENGSLSKKELDKLNEAAQKDWDEKKKKKKIKAVDVEKWELHKKCIKMWKNESECRDRKANTKEMGGGLDMTGDIGNRRDNASLLCAPPPYNHSGHSRPSPYRSLQGRLQVLKVDPDLDSCPPALQQQPQQQEQHRSEDRQRDETSGPADSTHGQATGGTERPSADMASPPHTKSGKTYGPEVSSTSPLYRLWQTVKGLFLGQNTAPMVEVSGPTSPILVYRPWSPSEIMEHAKNLLPTAEDGVPHYCETVLSEACTPRPDLSDEPLHNSDLVLFCDGSSSRDSSGHPVSSTPEERSIWKANSCTPDSAGIWRSVHGKPCLPRHFFPWFAKLSHGMDHVSKGGMVSSITSLWFTKGFTVVAENYCKKCLICAGYNTARPLACPPASHTPPNQPFDHVMMDFI
ncbi:uncharacterized protein LOC121654916 [Melanotaenia boesemani]|uniref:uncharacterized protein LOC121654916 n=1 Tax=Melanotaenia boesemani TaxID=1250792 RepID=UPI001C058F50|nr:uncharacterized protein LOC121654916 [Melanotaenia boesemani]